MLGSSAAAPIQPSNVSCLYAIIRTSFSSDPRLAPGMPLFELLAIPEERGSNSPPALFDRLFDESFQSKSIQVLPNNGGLCQICDWIIHFLHLRQGRCTAKGAIQAKGEQHSARGAPIRNPQAYAWRLFTKKAGKPAHKSGLGRLESASARSHDGHVAPLPKMEGTPGTCNRSAPVPVMVQPSHPPAHATPATPYTKPVVTIHHANGSAIASTKPVVLQQHYPPHMQLKEAHCLGSCYARPQRPTTLAPVCARLPPAPGPPAHLASRSSCGSLMMGSDTLSLLSGSDEDERSGDAWPPAKADEAASLDPPVRQNCILQADEAASLDPPARRVDYQPPLLKTHSNHDSFLAGLYAAQDFFLGTDPDTQGSNEASLREDIYLPRAELEAAIYAASSLLSQKRQQSA